MCWVFVSVRGLSLVVASGDHSSSRCAGLSLSRPLLLRSTGSRRAGSVVGAHGPSCSAACRIFPDQGSNPCPLHWQADSQPLRHQGSPLFSISITTTLCPYQATIISHLCTGTNSNWSFCSVLTPPFHSPYCTQNDFFFLNTYLILLLPCLKYFSNSPEAESKCLHCIQAL